MANSSLECVKGKTPQQILKEKHTMEVTHDHHQRTHLKLAECRVEAALNSYFPTMEWSDEDIILEIGCGHGKLTKNILLPKCPKLKKIIAIDINLSSVEYAKKTHSDEKIEFKTQDILDGLYMENFGKCDKIVSFFAIHHIPDFEKLFSIISSILNPGGHFLFVTFSKAPIFSLFRELSTNKEWLKYVKPEDLLALIPQTENWEDAETEFKDFVSRFGLRVTNSKCEVVTYSFSDKKQFLDLFSTLAPTAVLKNVEPEVKDRLWKLAVPIILKYCTQKENGEISINNEVFQVSGIKTI